MSSKFASAQLSSPSLELLSRGFRNYGPIFFDMLIVYFIIS